MFVGVGTDKVGTMGVGEVVGTPGGVCVGLGAPVGDGATVGIIVGEAVASPSTCSPLFAIIKFRFKVTFDPASFFAVTVTV